MSTGFAVGNLKLGFKAGKLLGTLSTRWRRQVPSSQGHLATIQTNVLLTGTFTNPIIGSLIPFLSL